MGTGSKVVSVILRTGEFCSAVIVVSLLGRFFYLLHIPSGTSTESRLIYAMVISAIEIVAAMLLIIPLKYSFYAWPLDFIFFILSIVAFGLLANLSSSCTSGWYYNYWGYYWGRFWRVTPFGTVSVVGSTGCGSWRAILSFLFLGAFAWLLSAILGAIVFMELRKGRETHRTTSMSEKLRKKPHQADLENHPENHPENQHVT